MLFEIIDLSTFFRYLKASKKYLIWFVKTLIFNHISNLSSVTTQISVATGESGTHCIFDFRSNPNSLFRSPASCRLQSCLMYLQPSEWGNPTYLLLKTVITSFFCTSIESSSSSSCHGFFLVNSLIKIRVHLHLSAQWFLFTEIPRLLCAHKGLRQFLYNLIGGCKYAPSWWHLWFFL